MIMHNVWANEKLPYNPKRVVKNGQFLSNLFNLIKSDYHLNICNVKVKVHLLPEVPPEGIIHQTVKIQLNLSNTSAVEKTGHLDFYFNAPIY